MQLNPSNWDMDSLSESPYPRKKKFPPPEPVNILPSLGVHCRRGSKKILRAKRSKACILSVFAGPDSTIAQMNPEQLELHMHNKPVKMRGS